MVGCDAVSFWKFCSDMWWSWGQLPRCILWLLANSTHIRSWMLQRWNCSTSDILCHNLFDRSWAISAGIFPQHVQLSTICKSLWHCNVVSLALANRARFHFLTSFTRLFCTCRHKRASSFSTKYASFFAHDPLVWRNLFIFNSGLWIFSKITSDQEQILLSSSLIFLILDSVSPPSRVKNIFSLQICGSCVFFVPCFQFFTSKFLVFVKMLHDSLWKLLHDFVFLSSLKFD